MRLFLMMFFLATGAQADVMAVRDAAAAALAEMPAVRVVDRIAGVCGADETVNDQAAYCTTSNEVLVARTALDKPEAPYLVAHLFGHAVQVRHGVADVALREIRNRPSEEAMLRGLVERQVDCIAGYLVHRAGLFVPPLTELFSDDPFAAAHWGRDPLRLGPQISVDLSAREDWFRIGAQGDIAACGPGEFSSDLLVAALRQ